MSEKHTKSDEYVALRYVEATLLTYCDYRQQVDVAMKCLSEHVDHQVRHVPQGYWILHADHSATCSECHVRHADAYDHESAPNFCQHCGADMRYLPYQSDNT